MKYDSFQCLYYFDSEHYSLVELEIMCKKELPPEKKYHWLLFSKANQGFLPLEFKAKDEGQRVFSNSELSYDNSTGILMTPKASLSFKRFAADELNSSLRESCTKYLKQL